MKIILFTVAMALLSVGVTNAQIKNAKTETVKVFGNCSMCEGSIEKAANEKKVSQVEWDKDSKMAVITYDAEKTNLSAVLKKIALAGYDNEQFLAPDDVYVKLPGCCKYERENKTLVKMDAQHNHTEDMGMEKKSEAHKMDGMKEMKDTMTKDMKNEHVHHYMNKDEKTAINPDKKNVDKVMEKPKPVVKQVNELKTVADNYFLLKDALVRTDAGKAASDAKNLSAAIVAVDMGKLSEKDHIAWMKVMTPLKTAANNIAAQKSIDKQRTLFIGLSENMYSLVKSTRPAGTVYYQHCPMANNGKGANWLSKEAVIKNPYYGSMMLSCGSVTETIK